MEIRALRKFAGGTLESNGDISCPAKINVAYNLVRRFSKKFSKYLSIDTDVDKFISKEFKLKAIPDSFSYFTTPLKHQEIALRYLYTVGSAGILLDPGLGKTKVILDYMALMKFGKSLIVCPKALLFVWEEEIEKHRPDLTGYIVKSTTWGMQIINLEKKRFPEATERKKVLKEGKYDVEERIVVLKERWELLKEKKLAKLREGWDDDKYNIAKHDIIIVNYDKVVTGQYYFEKLGFDFISVDEGLIKDPKTERTKAVTRLGKRIPYRSIMSGTLINNSPLDVFAPVRFLEPSLTGSAFIKFRDRYCTVIKPKANPNAVKQFTGSFIAGYNDVDEVRSILESCSIVMSKDEWLDLPPKKFHNIYCDMSDEQQVHYENLATNYITKVGEDYVEVDSALTVMCKLSQIPNGFIYIYNEEELDELVNDDDSEFDDLDLVPEDSVEDVPEVKRIRKTHFFKAQPKIDKFRTLYREKLHNRKFIMWYNMSAEAEIIEKEFASSGVSYLSIKGGEKDTGGKVKRFNTDPSIQILLCQAKSVNYGITVLGSTPEKLEANGIQVVPDINPSVFTQVFYSLNYSLELFLQQQDRCHRIGQDKEVDYYLLLTRNTTDMDILSRLDEKMNIRASILVDVLNLLKERIGNKGGDI